VTISETKATAALAGTCTGGAGPDLSDFPLLAYVPAEGVRIASNGTRAAQVALDAALEMFGVVAARYGLTAAEVEEAYRFYYTGGNGD
jgi:hypothetical protein